MGQDQWREEKEKRKCVWIIIIHLLPADSRYSAALWSRSDVLEGNLVCEWEMDIWSKRRIAMSVLYCNMLDATLMGTLPSHFFYYSYSSQSYWSDRAHTVSRFSFVNSHLYWHLFKSETCFTWFCWLTFVIISPLFPAVDVWESVRVDL